MTIHRFEAPRPRITSLRPREEKPELETGETDLVPLHEIHPEIAQEEISLPSVVVGTESAAEIPADLPGHQEEIFHQGENH